MTEKKDELFRKEAIESVTSPDKLTDYLRVSNPGVWVIMAAVILMLAGLLAWASVGKLETTSDAAVVIHDHTAEIILKETYELKEGMIVRVASQDYVIAAVETDEYGRQTGIAEITLPDGTYEGKAVIESIHPIEFLFESR